MKNILQNKKGFTLIELLAVIVILGVIMVIAVPAVTSYITGAKKDSMMSSAQSYTDAVITGAQGLVYELPVEPDSVTVVYVRSIELKNKIKNSAFGSPYTAAKSYVVIHNAGDATNPNYKYYVALQDAKGNTIKLSEASDIKRGNVIAGKTTDITDAPATAGASWTVQLPGESTAKEHKVENAYSDDKQS